MEKRSKEIFKRFHPLRLTKSDIFQIDEIISKHRTYEIIETDDMKLKNISELNDLEQEKINFFHLQTVQVDSSYLEIYFSKNEAYISASDENDDIIVSIYYKLEKFLNSKQKKATMKNIGEQLVGISTFCALFFIGINLFIFLDNILIKYLSLSLILICLLFLIKSMILVNNYVIIDLKNNKQDFFKEYKKEIFVSVFTIIGAIIGSFVTYLLMKQ